MLFGPSSLIRFPLESVRVYTCRECERPINQASELCPYCGADLTAPVETEPTAKTENPRKALVRRWLLWGTLVAGMWGFLWFVIPGRTGEAAAREAEQQAVEALRQAGKALAEFETATGRFPDSLEALTGESLATARAAAQRAQAMGYRLEYVPRPAEGGAVRTYSLLARPGNFSYRSFHASESGSIRWTRENRPATAQDRPL